MNTGQTDFPEASILIVDDVKENLRLLMEILSSRGYHVRPALNGRLAITAAQNSPPDLILLDILMPGMTGFEVCKQLKADKRTCDIPVIFVSAVNELADKVKAFSIGGVDYITKPFQTEEVLARVETHVAIVKLWKGLHEKNSQLKEEIARREQAEELLHLKNSDLTDALEELDASHRKIMSSLHYAKMIQSSLLPNIPELKTCLPNSFVIWMPRDIVGGDIFFAERFENGLIVSVMDCTGHGIPGAFMTMIASSGMRKIVRDEGCHDPAEILERLNAFIKTTLQQDTAHAISDDGMDAAIVSVQCQSYDCQENVADKGVLTFSGAKLPLLYVQDNKIKVVKGDRHSIGYRRSDMHYKFTNHTLALPDKGMTFYIATDGYTDQFGGQTNRRFGSNAFKRLILENSTKSFEEQKEILIRVFAQHKGENEQQDDMTVVGFSL